MRILVVLLFCAFVTPQDICIPTVRVNSDPQPKINQGAPGKAGPIGPPGVKGDQGSTGRPGECQCEETRELRNQMTSLSETVTMLQARVDGLHEALAMQTHQPSPATSTTRATSAEPASFCNIGMKDGRVKDDQLSASSTHSPPYGPHQARLDNTDDETNNRGAWHSIPPYVGRWIQVDLKAPTRVTGISTQGRLQVNCCWITSYKISYGNSLNQLQFIQDNGQDLIFQGNRDPDSHVTNRFPTAVTARYFRLVIHEGGPYLRMEFLTC